LDDQVSRVGVPRSFKQKAIPNQLGVDYNARLLDSVLRFVAPGLGWR
jgi:hypothetical protein